MELKASRNSPIVIAEVAALKQLNLELRAAQNEINQVERGKLIRLALIKNELENHRINGRPMKSKIKSICISLGLSV